MLFLKNLLRTNLVSILFFGLHILIYQKGSIWWTPELTIHFPEAVCCRPIMLDLLMVLALERFPNRKGRHSFKILKKHMQEEYEDSTYTSVLEEVASYENELGTVDIMTDARHGWRKNAKTPVLWQSEKRHTKFSLVNMSLNLMILWPRGMKDLELKKYINIWKTNL